MEIALFVNNKTQIVKDVGSIEPSYSNNYQTSLSNNIKKTIEWLKANDSTEVSHIYYGSEFCEKALPTPEQIVEFALFCQEKSLMFVYITPPLTNYGMKICKATINALEKSRVIYDVVFNDIGLLFWYKNEFNKSAILGRLFDKTSHDGRVGSKELEELYGEQSKCYAVSSNVFSKQSKKLFDKYNVKRVELDLPNLQLNTNDIIGDASVYLPFSFLTTGRRCMIGSVNNENSIEKCSKLCKTYGQLMTKSENTLGLKKQKTILRKGNTIYYIPEGFASSINYFNRVILELQL